MLDGRSEELNSHGVAVDVRPTDQSRSRSGGETVPVGWPAEDTVVLTE